MKILFINTLYSPYYGGGAEITLKSKVEGMLNRGHQVVVLSTGPVKGLHEELIDGVRVLRAGIINKYWPYSYSQPSRLEKVGWHIRDVYNESMKRIVEGVIAIEQPDIVSIHNLVGWSASVWDAISPTNIPVVQVLHDLYNLCPGSLMFRNGASCKRQCLHCKALRAFTPNLSNRVDAVVGVSRFVLDLHLNNGLFEKAIIKRAIHNARKMNTSSQTRINNSSNGIRFGFIGTLAEAKGIELLLQVFASSDEDGSTLIVAGKGRPSYESDLIKRFGDRVRFLGQVTPSEFYPNVDVLIVPSISNEALGMVVPEAFAFGIPVIASARGGLKEMVLHGDNGFLFEPSKPRELFDLMDKFKTDSSLLNTLSHAAKLSAAPYLDFESWIDSYEGIYMELIDAKR